MENSKKGKKMDITPLVNLMLNLSGGLLPEHLTKEECKMLEEEFGKNWFEELGYFEPDYKKPE